MRASDFLAELALATRAATPGDGRAWESDVRTLVVRRCVITDGVPGGTRLLGLSSISGLGHQLDMVAVFEDAIVLAELKAHRGLLPKNEVLRFAAATEDLYLGLGPSIPARPIYRVIAGPMGVSPGIRVYAAQQGILIVEPSRWPPLLLADREASWNPDIVPPSDREREALASLARPLQEVLERTRDGRYVRSRPPTSPELAFALAMHEQWSSHHLALRPGTDARRPAA